MSTGDIVGREVVFQCVYGVREVSEILFSEKGSNR